METNPIRIDQTKKAAQGRDKGMGLTRGDTGVLYSVVDVSASLPRIGHHMTTLKIAVDNDD